MTRKATSSSCDILPHVLACDALIAAARRLQDNSRKDSTSRCRFVHCSSFALLSDPVSGGHESSGRIDSGRLAIQDRRSASISRASDTVLMTVFLFFLHFF